jgi:nitroreductase
MNVIDALNSRATVRAFKSDPVDKKTIFKILEAATRAPSWANTQPWEIFVASGQTLNRLRDAFAARFQAGEPRNPDFQAPQTWPPALQKRTNELIAERAKLSSTNTKRDDITLRQATFTDNYRFFGAPTVVYLCMDRALTQWSMFDMGLLAQSIMLAAQHYGVDTAPAFLFASYPDVIRAELDIPENLAILIGVALGYADTNHPQNQYRSPRRPIEDVVRYKDL